MSVLCSQLPHTHLQILSSFSSAIPQANLEETGKAKSVLFRELPATIFITVFLPRLDLPPSKAEELHLGLRVGKPALMSKVFPPLSKALDILHSSCPIKEEWRL